MPNELQEIEMEDFQKKSEDVLTHEVIQKGTEMIPKTKDTSKDVEDTIHVAKANSEESTTSVPKENPLKSEEKKVATTSPAAPLKKNDSKAENEINAEESEDEKAVREKIDKIRASYFALAVSKHKKPPHDELEKKENPNLYDKAKEKGGEFLGAVGEKAETIGGGASAVLTGLGAYNTFGAGRDLYNGKNSAAPTGQDFTKKDKLISVISNLIVGGLAIKKVVEIFKKNSGSSISKKNSPNDYLWGKNTLLALPNLLKMLCMIAETSIIGFAKNTQASKNALNFLLPSKSFLALADGFFDFVQIRARLGKYRILQQKPFSNHSKLTPVVKVLEEKAGSMWPKMIAGIAETISQLTYAITFAKNPNSSATLASKIIMSGASIAKNSTDFHYNRFKEELKKPSQEHKQLSSDEYESFAKLSEDSLYLGVNPEIDSDSTQLSEKTLSQKQTAVDAYENLMDEFDVLGVSNKELSEAKTREEQKNIIAAAIGY